MTRTLEPTAATVAGADPLGSILARPCWGEHFCLVYGVPGEPLPVAAAYLRDGLRRGERCAYVVDDHSAEQVIAALADAGVDVCAEQARGALILTDAAEYGRVRPFDPAGMCERLRGLVEEALGADFAGLRLVVDMSWTLGQGVGYEQLIEYEAMTNALVFARGHVTAICMYNRHRFPADVIQHVVDAHPALLVGDRVLPSAGHPEWTSRVPAQQRNGSEAMEAGAEERIEEAVRVRMAQARAAVARRLGFLAEAGRVLASSLDFEATLSRAARLAVPIAGDYCVIDLVEEDGSVRRVAAAHRDPAKEELAAELRRFPPDPGVAGGVGKVLRTGEPEIVSDVGEAVLEAATRDAEHRRILRELGPRAYMIVPMVARGRAVGAISLAYTHPGRRPGPDELSLAQELASRAALAIENARLYRDAQTEIAERRRSEELLARSEGRFRRTFEGNPHPMWILDLETLRFLDANEASVRNYGYSREEFLAMTIRDLHPPEEIPALVEAVEQRKGLVHRGEFRHRRRDGTLIDVEITSHEITLEGRAARAALAVDVTEQKALQEQIRAANQQLLLSACREQELTEQAEAAARRQRFLADAGAELASSMDLRVRVASLARLAVPDLGDVCVVDVLRADGEMERMEAVHANPARRDVARALLRVPPALKAGGGVGAALCRGEPVLEAEVTDEILEGFAVDAEHLQVLRQLRPRSFLAVPLIARGHTVGAISFAFSDSGRRHGPEDLSLASEFADRAALAVDNARLYEQATRAVRARERILALVSHELRDPLQAILLQLENLSLVTPQDLRPESERRGLAAIESSADRMIRLVHDLLDLTRIDAGNFAVHPAPENVERLVEEALRTLEPLTRSHSVRLEVQIRDGSSLVQADRQRCLQVFSNLVGNAVRHTPAGGTIRIDAAAAHGEVLFSVSDTGDGIAAEQLPHVFTRSWTRSQAGGVGLGLSITRSLVEAHGGKIWAESRVGVGTTVYFTLPTAAASASADPDGRGTRAYEHVAKMVQLTAPAERHRPSEETETASARREVQAVERRAAFLEVAARQSALSRDDLVGCLRQLIVHSVHAGFLRPGDRLPSIREVTEQFGTGKHAATTAYSLLTEEGWVEKRDRSGMYVADMARAEPLGETAAWLSDVLEEAWHHRIKVPLLPDLVRRYTAGTQLRCACIDSDADTLNELCTEVSQHFGLQCSAVTPDKLPPHFAGSMLELQALPAELREADLLITTAYHATQVRSIAGAIAKPCVVMTANPDHIATVERRAREGQLTVVCADPRFGERIRALRGGKYREAIRVLLADDPAVRTLDRADPVLLTRAAYERLGGSDLRLLVPFAPFFSAECARDVGALLIRLNLESERT